LEEYAVSRVDPEDDNLVETRAIRKGTSDELLTKQEMGKKNCVIYKKYVHT
jgi:hypothetical protein